MTQLGELSLRAPHPYRHCGLDPQSSPLNSEKGRKSKKDNELDSDVRRNDGLVRGIAVTGLMGEIVMGGLVGGISVTMPMNTTGTP